MRRPDWWPAQRGARRRLSVAANRIQLSLPGKDGGAETVSEPFDGLATLAAAIRRLVQEHPGHGAIDVRVAAGHARLFLVPWVAQLTSAARWQTYAASRFEQIHGEVASDWVVRVAPELPPRARLAVALPLDLVRAVSAGLAAPGAGAGGARQGDSLRVALLDQVGDLVAAETRFSGCIVDIDAAAATLLIMVQGELRRVRTRHFDALDELVGTLRSEWAAFGIAAAAVNAAVAMPASSLDEYGAPLAAALGSSRVVSLAA